MRLFGKRAFVESMEINETDSKKLYKNPMTPRAGIVKKQKWINF